MKKTTTFRAFLILGTGFILSATVACDVRTELKEMHDSTKKMEGHTAKMVEITEKMEQTTAGVNKSVEETNKQMTETKGNIATMVDKMDHMSENTDALKEKITEVKDVAHEKMTALKEGIDQTYDGLRQGDSAAARRAAFKGLIEAKSHEKKLSEASLYYAAFEYQLYNGIGLDAEPARREKLILFGIQQFFKDIYEVYNYDPEVNPLADPTISDAANLEASFNALAAALHKDNPKQKEALQTLRTRGSDNFSETHFLKIIKEALAKKPDLESGRLSLSDISDIHLEVLNNEQVAIKLLQARWSFLLVSALDKNIQFKKGGHYYKYLVSGWKLVARWDLDFAKLNKSQIEEQHLYIQKAFETREFLQQFGVSTKNYFLTKYFIERMNPKNMDKLDEEYKSKAYEILDYLNKLKE